MNFENDYYVISKDFKIISFNKSVEDRYKGIKTGDYCYKATMNRESPCLHCPIAGNADLQNPIYFDPFYNGWVQACFAQLKDETFGVTCYPVESSGLEILDNETLEKLKKGIYGKAANSELHTMLREQAKIIEGFKGIFFASLLIDLEKNYYRKIYNQPEIAEIEIKAEGFAEPILKQIVDVAVAPESKEVMRRFNDFETMSERLKGKTILLQDYIGIKNGWCRAVLIPIEKKSNNKVTKFLYGVSLNPGEFKDPLTNCANRKALDWAYESKGSMEESIAVILCDINGLKKINDTEGHTQGDLYLQKAADVYSEFFGRNHIYRIGGDEFVIVLINCDKQEVGRKVMDLKKRCEEEGINISLGYEFRPVFSEPFEDILKAADNKMYAAKKEYYNRTGLEKYMNAELEQMGEYFENLVDFGSSSYMVCRIDVKKNEYKIIRTIEGYDTSFLDESKTLMDLFYFPVKKKVIFSEDVDDYVRWVETNFSNKPEIIKNTPAKKENWFRYKSNYNKKVYRLTEVLYIPGRNFSEDNQYGYVYLRNMGNLFEKGQILFGEILKNLSENFESVFYLNLEKNEVIPYRISKHIENTLAVSLAKEGKLFEGIQEYINSFVVESEKENMRKICSVDFLEEQLRIKPAYSNDFTALVDGQKVYYRIKFANMDGPGDLKHCAVGFANINSDVLHRKQYTATDLSVLIVEDSKIDRAILRNILEPEYKVIEAESGTEAQEILSHNLQTISMIITDLEMPGGNGYELLEVLQQNPFYKNIPVIVATAHDDDNVKVQCLETGVADFVSKPYNRRIIKNRINNIFKFKNQSFDTVDNEIDSLTGLYKKDAFFRYARILLDNNKGTDYVIILSDIIGFKTINDQYGKEKGDEVLKYLAKPESFFNTKIFSGRISNDVFASLLTENQLEKIKEAEVIDSIQKNAPVPVTVKFGLYLTKDGRDISVQQMCDRADIALSNVKKQYGVFSAIYDNDMRDKLLLEQQIVDSMEAALKEEQFEVYFQPKHSVNGKELSGAETLIRWNHPVMGFMNPGLFIPLFEKNGFISKLDRYIWRKTCEEISFWISQGIYFPISVNVSRKDFSDPDLASFILELTNEYNIPHELLHIEVTESAYSDTPEQLKRTVKLLHSNGFVIELDDFGTGYSSLTAINSFDIDILKLDISLLKSNSEKNSGNVLEFSMQLAKMMKVKTIQEGVETEEEFARMKALGCDYIQGYYFSKPLPKPAFEEYVKRMNGKGKE